MLLIKIVRILDINNRSLTLEMIFFFVFKFEIKRILRILTLLCFILRRKIKINETNYERIINSQTGDQKIDVSEIGGNNVKLTEKCGFRYTYHSGFSS